MPFIFSVDIGGTFTDLVACDLDSGALSFSKSPTTYDDLGRGVFDCIRRASVDARDAIFVKHGTTLVINALLQRSGAVTALVTTRGFADVLEIARGNRMRPFDLRFRRDEPLIPHELRFEVSERMLASGQVETPLAESELKDLAGRLREAKVEAVAISFLNAYANPEHEQRAAKILRELLPGTFVTSGTEVTREWHEFERTATAASNAYVGPQVSRYVEHFDASLRKVGFPGSLLFMGSHGGVVSSARTVREPISLVESGPVGGCIGAARYAASLGLENIIAFDMGGTTAKCILIENGEYAVESTYYIGGEETGFPIRGNVIDIVEVGAGGGSIAWVDEHGGMSVGPRSAGSTPGPVCYGRGGTEPTVTDANLVLGRLDAGYFLGGEMKLDAPAAQQAIAKKIAEPLQYRGESAVAKAASGILTIAGFTMADAIKRISISRGKDPRDFALVSYGGGGPLHSAELARELHIPFVIIPPEPGTFSATGMLLAEARLDSARTFVAELSEASMQQLTGVMAELQQGARAAMEADFGSESEANKAKVAFRNQAELRYVGQKHSLKVALPEQQSLEELSAIFHRAYRQRYGHSMPGAPVEFVAIHVAATLEMRRPRTDALMSQQSRVHEGRPRTRPVYFLDAERYVPTPVYNRYDLPVGFAADGPAVIEEYGATTLVGPRDKFSIGELKEIKIDCRN